MCQPWPCAWVGKKRNQDPGLGCPYPCSTNHIPQLGRCHPSCPSTWGVSPHAHPPAPALGTGSGRPLQGDALFLLHLTACRPFCPGSANRTNPSSRLLGTPPDQKGPEMCPNKLGSCTTEPSLGSFDSNSLKIKLHLQPSVPCWYWIRVQKNIINVLLQGKSKVTLLGWPQIPPPTPNGMLFKHSIRSGHFPSE